MKTAPHQTDIMIALGGGPTHGYEIMKRVDKLRAGKKDLGPAQLYTGLQKLLDLGIIEEIDSEDPRRRVYKLTQKGNAARIEHLSEQIKFIQRAQEMGQTGVGAKWPA